MEYHSKSDALPTQFFFGEKDDANNYFCIRLIMKKKTVYIVGHGIALNSHKLKSVFTDKSSLHKWLKSNKSEEQIIEWDIWGTPECADLAGDQMKYLGAADDYIKKNKIK